MEYSLDFLHYCGNSSSIIEELSGPFSGGTQIKKVMRSPVKPVECLACDCDPVLVSYGRKMKKAVSASRNCCVNHDCILEAVHCNDVARFNALFCEFYDSFSGVVCVIGEVRTCCGQ